MSDSKPDVVHVVLDSKRHITSIHYHREIADNKCQRYNSDPYLSPGQRDPGTPYTVETWEVRT